MDQNINTGAQPEAKGGTSAMISIVVIVLVLGFGAFYFFKQVPIPAETGSASPVDTQADPIISALSTQGTSTELVDIQKDLNATDLTSVGNVVF